MSKIKGQERKKSENMKYQISHHFFFFFARTMKLFVCMTKENEKKKYHQRLILSTIYNEEKLQGRNMLKHEN